MARPDGSPAKIEGRGTDDPVFPRGRRPDQGCRRRGGPHEHREARDEGLALPGGHGPPLGSALGPRQVARRLEVARAPLPAFVPETKEGPAAALLRTAAGPVVNPMKGIEMTP